MSTSQAIDPSKFTVKRTLAGYRVYDGIPAVMPGGTEIYKGSKAECEEFVTQAQAGARNAAAGVTLTDHEAALLYVAARHNPVVPFALLARLQDAYARNANAAPAAPVGTPAGNDATTTAARYETYTFGALSIIGWRHPHDGVARFTLWNEDTILPNVAWADAWAFIANRVHHMPSIERVLREALALNEGR